MTRTYLPLQYVLLLFSLLLVGCHVNSPTAQSQNIPAVSAAPATPVAVEPTRTPSPSPTPTQLPSPAPSATQLPPTHTPLPPSPTPGIGSPVIELGWLELMASGVISADQANSGQTVLTARYLIHGRQTYLLEIPADAKINVPSEDRQGGKINIQVGNEHIYRVEGTLAEPIRANIFTASYPVIKVTTIERIEPSSPPPGLTGQITYVSNTDGLLHFLSSDSPDQALTSEILPVHRFWSPDGSKLAYTVAEGENLDIYVMNADGSHIQRLTDNPTAEWYPAWSPDGSQIAYSYFTTGQLDIYLMNADGTQQRALITHPSVDIDPAWSPDGSQLAFATFRDGNSEIYSYSFADQNLMRLTNNSLDDAYPTWSPDGKFIAFNSNQDGDKEIYIMNADGTEWTQVTHNDLTDENPAWSPDGSMIMFESGESIELMQLFVIHKDGTGLVQLTYDPSGIAFPVWRP